MVSYKNIVLMMLLGLSKGGDATLRGGLTNGELNAEESTPAAAIVSKMQAFIDDADKMSYKEAEKLVEEMVEHYETREEELAEIGVNQEGIALIDVKYNELLAVLDKKVEFADISDDCKKYVGDGSMTWPDAAKMIATLKNEYEKALSMSLEELEDERETFEGDVTNHNQFYKCLKFTKEEVDDVEANFDKLLDKIEESIMEKKGVEGEKEGFADGDNCEKYPGKITATEIIAGLQSQIYEVDSMSHKDLVELFEELTNTKEDHTTIYSCYKVSEESISAIEDNFEELWNKVEDKLESGKEEFADGNEKNFDITRLNELVQSLKEKLND